MEDQLPDIAKVVEMYRHVVRLYRDWMNSNNPATRTELGIALLRLEVVHGAYFQRFERRIEEMGVEIGRLGRENTRLAGEVGGMHETLADANGLRAEVEEALEAARRGESEAQTELEMLQREIEGRLRGREAEVISQLERGWQEKEQDYREEVSGLQGRLEALTQEMKELAAQRALHADLFHRGRALEGREAALTAREKAVEALERALQRLGPEGLERLDRETRNEIRAFREEQLRSGRVSSGDPELDKVLIGGYPSGASVMVVGPAYSRRKWIVTRFVADSAKNKFPTLYVTTIDSSAQALEEIGFLVGQVDPKDSTLTVFDAYSEGASASTIHSKIKDWMDGLPKTLGMKPEEVAQIAPRVAIGLYSQPVKNGTHAYPQQKDSLHALRDFVRERRAVLVCGVDPETHQEIGALRAVFHYEVGVNEGDGEEGEIYVRSADFPVNNAFGLAYRKVAREQGGLVITSSKRAGRSDRIR